MNACRLTAAALAMAIALAGCGGGDESSTTPEALSKDEFIAQADQICADANDSLETAIDDASSSGQPSPEVLTQLITDTLLPTVQGAVDQIRTLAAPTGEEEQVAEILDSFDRSIEDARADPEAALNSTSPFEEAEQLAADFGLQECDKL